MEAVQNRTKELEFQLREATERYAMLEDTTSSRHKDKGRATLGFGLADGGRGTPSPSPSRSNSYSNNTSAAEVQRVLAEAETRFEAKLADMRFKIRSLESERNEAEEEWAAKLQERVGELEKLRRTVTEKESEYAESLRTRRGKEAMIEEQQEAKRAVEREMKALRAQVEEAKDDVSIAAEAEVRCPLTSESILMSAVQRAARDELSSFRVQISTLQSQLEDAKSLSSHLRSGNKTLRDELRKVQSSVQLMERQRNPGVGYWSTQNPGTGPARSGGSTPMNLTQPATPTREIRRSLESATESLSVRTGTGQSSPAASEIAVAKDKEEEEVNLEVSSFRLIKVVC